MARTHGRRIIEPSRQEAVSEWQTALEHLFNDIEMWSRERDWAVRRDSVQITENGLGTYEAPRLLVHTTENKRYFFEPIAREVAGGDSGRVEMCLMPSYDSAALVRMGGAWYVLPMRPGERRQRWSRQTFFEVANRLASSL